MEKTTTFFLSPTPVSILGFSSRWRVLPLRLSSRTEFPCLGKRSMEKTTTFFLLEVVETERTDKPS